MNQDRHTVAVTGATGFVGRHVVPRLLAHGYRVRALVRDPARLRIADPNLQTVTGDLFHRDALDHLVENAHAVVHMVGIIMERPGRGQTFERVHDLGTRNLLAAAAKAGVKRWVHMSALGVRPGAVARYHQSKWQAECAVRDSGLSYTIFRPSIIHGPDGEFMKMVKDFCCKRLPPFMPYFGAGAFGGRGAGRLQPVWVEDVAECFAAAIANPLAVGEVYPMGGPDVFTWPELFNICKSLLPCARPNKRPRAVPVWFAKLVAQLPGAPFNVDQVIMSQEDSTCRIAKVQTHFGRELAAFEPTFADYAAQIP